MKELLWRILPVDNEAKLEAKRDNLGGYPAKGDQTHLNETVNWLKRAQDYSSDGGVSRAFKAAKYMGHGQQGWQPSYPETTGYIIPTMLCLSEFLPEASLKNRVKRMADWEIDIQLPTGAVMGSVVSAQPSPAVFNTGQVIFGWLAAFRESGQQKYLKAALRAGEYLVSVQAEDGSWDKSDSKFALKGATTYNTRVAWALIELGLLTREPRYVESGRKFNNLALGRQAVNGWYAQNCLNDQEKPLLHTIVYATRGILESGILLEERKYVEAAIKTLDALLKCQREDGGLPGRLAADWSPQAIWDCVTGDAQVAVAWLRAHAITGEQKYRDAARAAIEFVKRTQNLEHQNSGIRGGIKGSFPFDGPYGKFEMLNWAAKFFCDALMMANDDKLAKKGIKG